MIKNLPKRTQSAQQGDQGVSLVSRIIEEEFKWIFKRTHQEHDYGIDGQIEVVADGYVTSQLIEVQIKYGKTFFKNKNNWGYVYRGENKHLNYLANRQIPVLIILCNPETKECYWVKFSLCEIQKAGDNWKITVPNENILTQSKNKIEAILAPIKDYSNDIELYWAYNKVIKESDVINFVIDKTEIEMSDTTRVRGCFDRLLITKEIAVENQGKVELSISGYDLDPQELFEIPEVREYISTLISVLPELFFFIRTEKTSWTLNLFILSLTDLKNIKAIKKQSPDYKKSATEFTRLGSLGLTDICNRLSLPREYNDCILRNIENYFGISG